jgi:ketosteroid isomerase-like protein
MPDHDAASVVDRYFAACNTQDVVALQGTLTQDVVHYFLASDRPAIRGADHLAHFWRKFTAVLAARWSVDHMMAFADEAVCEWTLYWTHPETGRRRVNRGTEWYILRNGRIAEIRAYFYFPATAPLMDENSELTEFPYSERAYLVEQPGAATRIEEANRS